MTVSEQESISQAVARLELRLSEKDAEARACRTALNVLKSGQGMTVAEFIERGQAAQAVVDSIIAAEQSRQNS